MKQRRKADTGIILLGIFLISTILLLIGNYFDLIPKSARMFSISAWLVGFILFALYVCIHHTVKQYVSKR